eukprot:86708-Lingulodinium_polyedra.AAC.1
MECVPERMSEQLSRESCSEMRSGMHSVAAMPRVFAERALHATTMFWRSRGARVWRKHALSQRWN